MKNKLLSLFIVICIALFGILSCESTQQTSSSSNYKKVETTASSNLWTGYKNWYKVTKDAPNTGDPTGFIEKRHNGNSAYREIYMNDIGATVNKGNAPYKYPEGTIVVKESYKNKAAWEKKGKKLLTVMIKQAEGSSPETGDWGFIMGARGKLSTRTSKWAKFCSGCHVYAASKDYVFMNTDFIKSLK